MNSLDKLGIMKTNYPPCRAGGSASDIGTAGQVLKWAADRLLKEAQLNTRVLERAAVRLLI
jgi:hypothetical protein